MFGLIGHSTSFEQARLKARSLGYDEYADGDLDMWCAAPPQLVERVTVTSLTGQQIEGAYIDSVFVPEMLRRFKTAKRKVLKAMELAQKNGITITALGGFTSIIFEDMNLLKEERVSAVELDWTRFTTGNTHTAWVICQQVDTNAPRLGIDLASAKVAVVGASGDIGSAVCRWLQRRGVGELLLVARRPQPLIDLQQSLGEGRILALEEALPEADVVVLVGARLNWLLSHGKGKTWGGKDHKAWGGQKYIQVDISPQEADSNVRIDAPVVGDIGSCVAAMLGGIKAAGAGWPQPSGDWLGAIDERKSKNIAKMGETLAKNPSPMNFHSALNVMRDIIKNTAGIRRAGAASLDLAYVAAGRLDGFWEFGLNKWDIAAGALLITEAGGLVGDLQGNDGFMEKGNIVAGNPKVFAQLLPLIAPHLTQALKS